MPFPMVHFFVAEAAFQRLGDPVDWPGLFLGAVAPDAYKRRQGAGGAERCAAHLERDDSGDWERDIFAFARDRAHDADRWFYLGYAAHLLTDLLWRDEIFAPFLERYEAAPEAAFSSSRAAYVADATAIELHLYHHCEYREALWRDLAAAKPVDLPGMVRADEIAAERDLTLTWYAAAEPPARVPGRIRAEQVAEFVERAARRVAGLGET